MQVTSTYRYARISAFKAREVTREIQGRSASDALDLLTFSPKKAAVMVRKTLKSAIANAENNADLKVDTLLVKEAVVGEGPTFKRFRARARGSASPLRKRTSHIRIVLADELAPTAPTGRGRKTQPAKGASGVAADDQVKSDPAKAPGSRKSSTRKPAAKAAKEDSGESVEAGEATSVEDKTAKGQASEKKEKQKE
ncbi:MAG: 50S ribosomal protein L22 [Verrucomicrobia bacterium]|nr:50S ribosomal protein L22 [Verrucomicrobiota bacterium]